MIYIKIREKVFKFQEDENGVKEIIKLFPMVKYIGLAAHSIGDCIHGIVEYLNSSHMECFLAPDQASMDEKVPEVASIAIFNNDRLLIGKRNDNGKYTLPGGHLNENESPINGAYRELHEETGIIISELKYLGTKEIECEDGKWRKIHAFSGLYGGKSAGSSNDPDMEVGKWIWVDVSKGLPGFIKNNLHSKKNVVFKFLGLQ